MSDIDFNSPTIGWQPVNSSVISAARYDDDQGALVVRFTSGKEITYASAPPEELKNLIHAGSPGAYLNKVIAKKYSVQS